MKKKIFPIVLFAMVILLLIAYECGGKNGGGAILKKIGTSLLADSFPVCKMGESGYWIRVVMGAPPYIGDCSVVESGREKMVYRENQENVNTRIEKAQEEDADWEAGGEGEGSAVAGANLPQVQMINQNAVGGAAYVNRLRENKDVNYLWNHFYIIDSTTSVTKKLFPVEKLLNDNLTLDPVPGKQQILIYHTHGASESFKNSRPGKENDSVIGVGKALKKELEKNGYLVYHDRTKYDLIDGKMDRSRAYNASLEGVTKIMAEHPEIQVTIDLHRDSVGKRKNTYTMIDGKRTAIVMFFNGMSRSRSGPIKYLENPNLLDNLAFSLQLKCHAMELFDGFTKPIYLKGYRYNLHVAKRSLLIELGNENNTVEEAKNAAAPLAKIISDVLKGGQR